MSADSRALAYCLHGGTLRDDDLYVMINAEPQQVRFGLHEGQPRDLTARLCSETVHLTVFCSQVATPFVASIACCPDGARKMLRTGAALMNQCFGTFFANLSNSRPAPTAVTFLHSTGGRCRPAGTKRCRGATERRDGTKRQQSEP